MAEDLAPSLNPIQELIASTPARVWIDRAGSACPTNAWLQLREDHAVARDAVQTQVSLLSDFTAELVEKYQLFEVFTQATTRAEYLRRPDLGRKLDDKSRQLIRDRCPVECDVQVVLGDGLSSRALVKQAPDLLVRLHELAVTHSYTWGQPFLVQNCRVGILNDIGDILKAKCIILLIGERPGLATAESLSAYLAYLPRSGHTDANRNLISNIHGRGTTIDDAAKRVLGIIQQYQQHQRSGVDIKEVTHNQLTN